MDIEFTPERALSVLQGLRLRQIGRAVDLLWLHFGDLQEIPSGKGGTRQVGEWALHVQTSWRFTRGSRIALGVRDLYYYEASGEFYDDWDKFGESRFDRIAVDLNREFEAASMEVTSIVCDRVGGFSLWFGREFSFDVFPHVATASPDFEFWRLFEPGKDSHHYVVGTEDSEEGTVS